jgi:hypothetical protein
MMQPKTCYNNQIPTQENQNMKTAKTAAVLFAGVALMLTGAAQGSALIMAAPFIILMSIICVKG